ncbi:MAG: hypothetical protein U5K37_05290 [Natrialbaceae archaeon]|nr:hypothetical protein [Natrialbaceae archaeon]
MDQLLAIINKAKEIGGNVVKYGYYPGCSRKQAAAAYDVSTRVVAEALGFELEELDDWNGRGGD